MIMSVSVVFAGDPIESKSIAVKVAAEKAENEKIKQLVKTGVVCRARGTHLWSNEYYQNPEHKVGKVRLCLLCNLLQKETIIWVDENDKNRD